LRPNKQKAKTKMANALRVRHFFVPWMVIKGGFYSAGLKVNA
jgi:hypothetical protein